MHYQTSFGRNNAIDNFSSNKETETPPLIPKMQITMRKLRNSPEIADNQ